MPAKPLPSPDFLRKILDYDSSTGELWWKYRPLEMFAEGPHQKRIHASWNSRWSGQKAFTHVGDDGYFRGAICGVTMRAHRVLFALHYGCWPDEEIDHINGIRLDNAIDNLRLVSRVENRRNQKKPCTNTSGFVGVYQRSDTNRWEAKIGVEGKMINLGCFATMEESLRARRAAEQKYSFHKNHGREA